MEREPIDHEPIERASLIDWICVRASHQGIKPVDPSTPLTLHDDGHWSLCPAGLGDDTDHLWYATGGVTRKALERFRWPTEAEVSASGSGVRPAG